MTLLQGKVAVVTGGGRGIGRGICLALAAAGAQVLVADFYRDEHGSAAESVVDEIRALGGSAATNTDSVATFEGADAVVDAAVKEFGRLDIMVTCAGNFIPELVPDVSQKSWDLTLAVHLTGTFACAQAAARQMIKQGESGGGRIITFASRAAFLAPFPAYGAAKAGIMGLTSALAGDLQKHGITVNNILPSANTQLFPGTAPRTLGGIPAAESMDPNDVSPVIVFLSGKSGEFVTGRFIYVAGGDICLYQQPLALPGSTFIRKPGETWTVEQLERALPTMLSVGQEGQVWSREKLADSMPAMLGEKE